MACQGTAVLLSLLPGAFAAVCKADTDPEARLIAMGRSCFHLDATPQRRSDVDQVIYKYFGAGGSTQGLEPPADAAKCLAAAREVVGGKCWGLEFPSYFQSSDVYVRALLWLGLPQDELRLVQNCSWSAPDNVGSEAPAAELSCPANGGVITYGNPRSNVSLSVKPQCPADESATVVVGDFAGGGFSVLEETWAKRRLLCNPLPGKGCWGNETGTVVVPAGQSSVLRLFVPAGGAQTYMGQVSWRAICESEAMADTTPASPTPSPTSGAVRRAGCLGVLVLAFLAN